MKNLSILLIVIFCSSFMYGQGSTTSSMSGTIIGADSEGLIGANILAVHTPTGATYGTSTDINGLYRIDNMKVGGPYKVTLSYTGFEDLVIENVNLRLGESFRRTYTLQETAIDLTDIVVTAKSGTSGQSSGASTQINSDDIDLLPTLNRDLKDFTRLTPQVKESFGGGISIAGINNRYNAIYIDGAVNNDVFGLAASGTNGGQTGASPFSIDIIDQIQVVISPFDVTYGGFAGGGINAVTKSGTNQLQGTAYYFSQTEGMAGETNTKLIERTGNDATKLDEFNQRTIGLSLGGPIVKDKLFFFTNVEIQNDETPVPFDIANYDGNLTEEGLQNFRNTMINTHGYDPGAFGNKVDKLEGLKFFVKFDYNLSDQHKLTLRHQYTNAEQSNVNGSSNRTINFANNGVFFPTTTNSSALELNSIFGSKASNNLILGYTNVRDDRDGLGNDFPYLIIRDGSGSLRLGSEQFSTANQLDQDIITLTNNYKVYKGRHTLTFGTHNELSKFYNLFIRQNFGVYNYNSVDDFLNGMPASTYDRSYSLLDDITGDGSAAAAEFTGLQLGFYAQDEWAVNNEFTLTYGLRLDIPFFLDDPIIHESFNTTTLPLLEAVYDLGGTQGGTAPDGQLMWSPRLGFNYNVNNKTTIRGGLGVFTSRIPFVWPGGMYINNGIAIGGVDEGDINGDVTFIADPNKQYTNDNFTVPSGQVDLFAKDFKYPQLFRSSLAIDFELPGGIQTTLEGVYSKNLNNVIYKNVNTDPTIDFNWTNGPIDNRPIFTRSSIDPTYSAVYLGSNTSEGYSYTATLVLQKDFANDFNVYAAYTYGESESLIEGTSSQNSSQWRGGFHVNGRNDPAYGRSDFSIGSRIVAAVSKKFYWSDKKDLATSFSFFYNGQSGEPFSYVYGRGAADGRNINNERGSTSRTRSLIYIPNNVDEINLIENQDGISPAEQWASLNTFINQDDYLSENRGKIAEKNGARTPFAHMLDLKVLQDITWNEHRLQLSLDIFNFANLLNRKWGVTYFNPFDYNLIQFEGYDVDGTTPQFTFNEEDLGDERFNINDRLSRWRMRVGVRYIFR